MTAHDLPKPADVSPASVGDVTTFDPSRIAASLGKLQRKVVLSLTSEWGEAADHRTAKRMFWGIRGTRAKQWDRDGLIYLVEHKHCTDNCWRLNELGQQVRAAIAQGKSA